MKRTGWKQRGLLLLTSLFLASCTSSQPTNVGACAGCFQDGICQPGDNPPACGNAGIDCAVCASGESCIDGACHPAPSCGPDTCPGCCTNKGVCADGTTASACGKKGEFCNACSPGTCNASVCTAPCGPTSCRGCCRSDGTCLTGSHPDAECGSDGVACAACAANEVCSLIIVEAPGDPAPTTAGGCLSKDCASCTTGCCATPLGGGVTCEPGDGTGALKYCGASGTSCAVCASDETCTNKRCVPNADVALKLVIDSAVVPTANESGVAYDYLSNPDVGITVSLPTTPLTTSKMVNGPDDTNTPTIGLVILTGLVGEFRRGMSFAVVDRDRPPVDPDDPIGTVPVSGYFMPPDDAFLGVPVTAAQNGISIKFHFEK